MFRSIVSLTRFTALAGQAPKQCVNLIRHSSVQVKNEGLALSHNHHESLDEFDNRYEGYFNDPNIDGWMIRKRLNDLHGMDLIPEPKILIAALKACRRVNDFALALRCLEGVKFKCANQKDIVWPYLVQELKPTLTELGIPLPEEIGYDKPELALENPYED